MIETENPRQSIGWLRQIVLLGLVMLLLMGCATPLASAPQVMVTRVPLDVTRMEAPASAVVGLALPTGGSAVPRASNEFTSTVSTQSLTPAEAEPDQPASGESAATEVTPVPATTLVEDPSLRTLQRTRNILLIGTDQRDLDYVGRTDTIMVLAIDAANNRASLISFPRDMYLPIPGVGYSRINTAYAYGEERKPGGGLPLLMSTIERNFGIPIERYVRIDFSGFQDVVDALGGVDVVVDCPLYDELIYRYFQVYTLEPGDYHMNGEQALYYARSRKTTSDFDRARRQQRVLLAIRKRVLDGNLLPRIPALWLAMRDIVDTNLGPADIADLAKLGATLEGKDLYGMVIRYPLVDDWVTPQGGMVQLPDLPAINEALDNAWERAPLQETNSEERLCP
ncbi:MAG TPA: LCP family protein [Anaerolineae bacterium]|nr:LCP family protein [Anaerolineae bacterium]